MIHPLQSIALRSFDRASPIWPCMSPSGIANDVICEPMRSTAAQIPIGMLSPCASVRNIVLMTSAWATAAPGIPKTPTIVDIATNPTGPLCFANGSRREAIAWNAPEAIFKGLYMLKTLMNGRTLAENFAQIEPTTTYRDTIGKVPEHF